MIAEAAAAVPEHRVGLVELLAADPDVLGALAGDLGELVDAGVVLGGELVEGRVDEADGDGLAVHGLEDALEVLALEGEELGERLLAGLDVVGDDHLLDGELALLGIGGVLEVLEEHVLGAAEADALGAELDGLLGVVRGVGVGADLEACGSRRTSRGGS